MASVFRAENEVDMADALLEVLQYARASSDSFHFGPRTLPRLMREGLTITGADTVGVLALLRTKSRLTED